jgi:hypothetical protein
MISSNRLNAFSGGIGQECMLCDLRLHIRNVREAIKPFYPDWILAHLRQDDTALVPGQQNDAHEFIR